MDTKEIKKTAKPVKFNGTITELVEYLKNAKAMGDNIKVLYAGDTYYSMLSDEESIYRQATGFSKAEFESFFEGKQIIDPAESIKYARELLRNLKGEVYPDRKGTLDKIIESLVKTGRAYIAEAIVLCIKAINSKDKNAAERVDEILGLLYTDEDLKYATLAMIEYSKYGHEYLPKYDIAFPLDKDEYLKDLSLRNKSQELLEKSQNLANQIKK